MAHLLMTEGLQSILTLLLTLESFSLVIVEPFLPEFMCQMFLEKPCILKHGVVVYTLNLSTWAIEAGGPGVQVTVGHTVPLRPVLSTRDLARGTKKKKKSPRQTLGF